MIGFGELRRFSVQWKADLGAVERVYCIDWVIKGLFDHAALSRTLILRGGAALRYAHCADYPVIEDPEFFATEPVDEAALRDALRAVADASGLQFALTDFMRGSAKVEYAGPLGRRSAAQPHIVLSFVTGLTCTEPVRVPLIHPFSDDCAATVVAIALAEFVAERVVMLAQVPRARDVFDLWFVLTHARERIDAARTGALAREIAQAKNVALPHADALLDSARHGALERAWENALRRVPAHPSFEQMENDLGNALKDLNF